ncbi:hypothetical protein C0Q70_14707 [Pomacea canaliculata]|uniref:Uncharacterized protein n=1 Tax=Pomacea canaliculata TaxID=400727 RepID=A0A2T7NSS8_POMCA|nr:hypothetical protein C0Q70_14707 [Pomacea canaliculata]
MTARRCCLQCFTLTDGPPVVIQLVSILLGTFTLGDNPVNPQTQSVTLGYNAVTVDDVMRTNAYCGQAQIEVKNPGERNDRGKKKKEKEKRKPQRTCARFEEKREK